MIHVIGDRRNSGFCLMCGGILIEPINSIQCCSECTKKIQNDIQEFHRKRKQVDKMKSKNIVHKKQIAQRLN